MKYNLKADKRVPRYEPDPNFDPVNSRCTGTVARQRRAFHVIDIENLAGGQITVTRCRDLWRAYTTRVGVAAGDQVLVATGPESAVAAWFGLPDWIRRVVGPAGRDGADMAILAAVDLEHVARRYESLVIGSGDGIFAPVAQAANNLGIEVTQVYGEGRTSIALYLACPRNVHLRALRETRPEPRSTTRAHRQNPNRSTARAVACRNLVSGRGHG